ncbi:MAG: glycosyltransferase [Lachnospiraceae bacterium]|nr:glycosyltransferase [Lachnospiraceae bacterium]
MEKKIAFYCSSLTKGGAERVFVNLAEYFNKKGYKVYIVTQYRHDDEYIISDDITRVISDLTPEETGKGRIKNFARRFAKLRRIFKEIRPDIVFACNGKNNLMVMATNTFLKNKVVISVVADPKMEYPTKLMRFLSKTYFACADGIVLQTNEAKTFFPKRIQKKSVILPNSLNLKFLKPRYEGKRKSEIVAVGRLDDNKNHAMLIRAFAKLAEEFSDYTVTVYGEGESRVELEKLITQLGMEQRVFLPGRADAIEEKIYQSSLFVMTSDTEGMPNALLEAMSLGLPVISTDCPCGGPRELIRHGENGYLIPVRDEEALYEQLRYCLSHDIEMNEVGKCAAKIQETMNPDSVNEAWEKYFNKVMNSGE